MNLRKGEAVVHFDASRITTVNLIEAVTKAGFEAVKKTEPLSLGIISGILILLFSIVGCSDMPYTGSMLTVDDVDKYITMSEGSACLLNGYASACLTLAPQRWGRQERARHPHPSKKTRLYFYHEGKQIVRAERAMDTSEIVKELTDPGTSGGDDQGTRGVRDDGGNNGNTGDGNNDGGNNGGNNGGGTTTAVITTAVITTAVITTAVITTAVITTAAITTAAIMAAAIMAAAIMAVAIMAAAIMAVAIMAAILQ